MQQKINKRTIENLHLKFVKTVLFLVNNDFKFRFNNIINSSSSSTNIDFDL